MAITKIRKQERSIGYEENVSRLNTLIEVFPTKHNDIDALDCLAQIIEVSNKMSRVIIVKKARIEAIS